MKPSILVVEDSASMRSFIVTTIEEMNGYQIFESGSGFEALKLLPRQRFDLIITDINMPDINGLELIRYVRSNPLYQDIPLFIITTERGKEDRKRGLALGANEYIVKPFDPKNLQKLVKKYISDMEGKCNFEEQNV